MNAYSMLGSPTIKPIQTSAFPIERIAILAWNSSGCGNTPSAFEGDLGEATCRNDQTRGPQKYDSSIDHSVTAAAVCMSDLKPSVKKVRHFSRIVTQIFRHPVVFALSQGDKLV